MAKANTEFWIAYEREYPHTARALQRFTMCLAKLRKNRGKTGLFGKDKGLTAQLDFENSVSKLISALRLDNEIEPIFSDENVYKKMEEHFRIFNDIFPNWTDAHQEFIDVFTGPEGPRLVKKHM